MSLLDDTIFQGPQGLLRYIPPSWLNTNPRIKKLEVHTIRDISNHQDAFYLYAWGRTTNHRTRTILNIRPVEIAGAITTNSALEKIHKAMDAAIPILETALRLAGEP